LNVYIRLLRIPSATYRLQFNAGLRLEDARHLVRYFADLGISDLCASGYDVVDHGTIDPAIGTQDDLGSLAKLLRNEGIGLILDVVPNHMGIDDQHVPIQQHLDNCRQGNRQNSSGDPEE